MKIAFIHYHLKPGGVTTVLRQQVEALKSEAQTLVLVGQVPPIDFGTEVVPIEGLGYDTDKTDRGLLSPESIAVSIQSAIETAFSGPCDVIHVHNPTLAKNKRLPLILKHLQQRYRFLLQIHDFAEDGRPSAFYVQDYLPDCHYAVINRRDRQLLIDAGLMSDGVHLLQNRIDLRVSTKAKPTIDNYVLYPIRAIRRKNLGEAILVSHFFTGGETLAITLPPNSPNDLASYRDWKAFVKSHKLPVVFDVGLTNDFGALMSGARYVTTTSITEGFGFSFLEPWLAGKLLWGRCLPDICQDFSSAGVALDHLYHGLMVPTAWMDLTTFKAHWYDCIRQVCRQYRYPLPPSAVDQACQRLADAETIDFGLLNETFQKEIIRRVTNTRQDAERLRRINPFLASPGYVADANSLIKANREQIESRFGSRQYQKALLKAYQKVIATPVRHRIDKQRLLAFFLRMERFNLLKWCPYAG